MFDSLASALSGVFGRLRKRGRLSESDVDEFLREIRIALLEADVNLAVAKQFIARIRERAVGEHVIESLTPDQTVLTIIHSELTQLLGSEPVRFNWSPSPPTVIVLCGLQGSGKTTTAAKLAVWLKKQGKSPMLAACDLQRPAAITQLKVLGDSIETPVFADFDSKDPVSVARRAKQECSRLFRDVLILDTAGRLQIDEPLMQELAAIKTELRPDEVLLVADSTTGQESTQIAERFDERLSLTGLIFSKTDGDTRGGAVLSMRAVTGKPVRFVGIGEQTDALEPFIPDRFAQRILGFGDITGLLEKAQQAIEPDSAVRLTDRVRQGKFDLEDMLQQLRAVRKMGSLKSVLKLLPGAHSLPDELVDGVGESGISRIEAILLSMTPKERRNPDILDASRKRRIAAGSGTSVQEINRLVKQLDEMKRQMKHLTKKAIFGKKKRR